MGCHDFNKIYRHSFLGTYREAGAWIKAFTSRMDGASPKAFSVSHEIREFFHAVCLDLILVDTGVFYQWQCPMGAMGTAATIPFHVGWCKSAWLVCVMLTVSHRSQEL